MSDSPSSRRPASRWLALTLGVLLAVVTAEGLARWAANSGSSRRTEVERILSEFRATLPTRPDLDYAWLYSLPAPPPQRPVRREHAERAARWNIAAVNYLFNEPSVRGVWRSDGGLQRWFPSGTPKSIAVFRPPGGRLHPRYRYPANVTLPTGLTVNRYGWRGPEFEVAKPPRTVRLACVGASTTVCAHRLVASYPELLGHWLDAWAERVGLEVRFEVINAGREGISSPDILAVVEDEVIAFDVDYVIYYEGSNQFFPKSLVRFPAGAPVGPPSEGILPTRADDDSSGLWRTLTRYSTLARLLSGASAPRTEPDKPDQWIEWPEGVDELQPDPATVGSALNLDAILGDLERMRVSLEERGARLVLSSYVLLAHEGLELGPDENPWIFSYLNSTYWPVRYALIERLQRFYNRVLEAWAREREVDFLDVAQRVPREPALFVDPFHNTDFGVRLRAWAFLEGLTTILQRDLNAGRIPRPPSAQALPDPAVPKERTLYLPPQ